MQIKTPDFIGTKKNLVLMLRNVILNIFELLNYILFSFNLIFTDYEVYNLQNLLIDSCLE